MLQTFEYVIANLKLKAGSGTMVVDTAYCVVTVSIRKLSTGRYVCYGGDMDVFSMTENGKSFVGVVEFAGQISGIPQIDFKIKQLLEENLQIDKFVEKQINELTK